MSSLIIEPMLNSSNKNTRHSSFLKIIFLSRLSIERVFFLLLIMRFCIKKKTKKKPKGQGYLNISQQRRKDDEITSNTWKFFSGFSTFYPRKSDDGLR